ncbi:unnamed protein product [Discosporangium mesarthrocarpum]
MHGGSIRRISSSSFTSNQQAILCAGGTITTVSGCKFLGNEVGKEGLSDPLLGGWARIGRGSNAAVAGISAIFGKIEGCVFRGNSATSPGGAGLALVHTTADAVVNCDFHKNVEECCFSTQCSNTLGDALFWKIQPVGVEEVYFPPTLPLSKASSVALSLVVRLLRVGD